MKLSLAVIGVFILIAQCAAQQAQKQLTALPEAALPVQPATNMVVQPSGPSASGPVDRFLFPRNFARGYVDFQMAPPHNEVDLGLCQVDSGAIAYRSDCNAYARYEFSGYLEIQPFGRGQLRRLFLIAEPKLFTGNNLPQRRYTYSSAPILAELSLGAGISLTDRLEVRIVTHKAHLMGRYAGYHSPVTLSPDGPYGSFSTVGVRYYFGNFGHGPIGPR